MEAHELSKCIESHPKNQSQIADDIGVTRATMGRWAKGERKISNPDAKLLRLYFYGEIPFEDIRPTQDLPNVLKFSPKEWDIINILALRSGRESGEWIASQIREYLAFREHQNSQAPADNITPLIAENTPVYHKEEANVDAAAGSEIEAEVINWIEGSRKLKVRARGDSMTPLVEDGEVIIMAPKYLAKRTESMAKGKIYLIRDNGGYKIKRYNTRKARPDEHDAEYLTSHGTVGVLESINPAYPPTDILSQDTTWEAWLEKDGSFPKDLE